MEVLKLMFSGILSFIFVCNVASDSNSQFSSIPFSALSKAMLGVDPVLSSPLGQRDPGLKNQIFVPSPSSINCDERIPLNNFIGKAVQDVRCSRVSSSSMRTATNFNSYRTMMSDSVSFNAGGGISAQYMGFGGGLHVGYGSSSNTLDEKHQEFFRQTEGEIILGGAECQTHVVSVKLNAKPVFTENFIIGLRKLNLAAQDPSSENSIRTFHDFVENFGTHFQDTTILGSKLVIEKLFAKKAANNAERTERQRCVSSSFTQNLQLNVLFVQAEQHFSRDANKCSGSDAATNVFNSLGLSSERIITVGTPPYSDEDKWAEYAMKTPVPIHYKLEKISRMFTQDWFDDYVAGEKFNGAAMRDFFENLSGQYCEIMFRAPCTATWAGCGYNSNCRVEEKCVDDNTAADGFTCRKGCGITSDCPDNKVCVNDKSLKGFRCEAPCSSSHRACSPGETCHVEPHSARGFICVPNKPGQAVIVGGEQYSDGHYGPVSTVESLNYKTFPDLPRAIRFSAIEKAGEYLYMCGGKQQDYGGQNHGTDDCYRIHARYPGDEWEEMQSAPIKISIASSVSIGKVLIWFISSSTLVKFNAETNSFSTTSLPFETSAVHCSVSNGTHAYVIGAGSGNNEIWTNKNPMDETEWELAGYLMKSRERHACLWFGSNIMITGGYLFRKDVEMINTETRQMWREKDLLTGLQNHKMMLHNGMPTVVGGSDGQYRNNLGSFSIDENKWISVPTYLNRPNACFALVEV